MLKLFVYIVPLCFLLFMSGGAAWAENADSSTVAPYLKVLDRNPNDQEALRAVGFHYLGLGNNVEARKYGRRLLEVGEKTVRMLSYTVTSFSDLPTSNPATAPKVMSTWKWHGTWQSACRTTRR